MVGAVVLGVLAAAALLGLVALTATGARRRGMSRPEAVAVGLAFPVTWIVWYVRDAPYQTSPARQSHATGASRSRS